MMRQATAVTVCYRASGLVPWHKTVTQHFHYYDSLTNEATRSSHEHYLAATNSSQKKAR